MVSEICGPDPLKFFPHRKIALANTGLLKKKKKNNIECTILPSSRTSGLQISTNCIWYSRYFWAVQLHRKTNTISHWYLCKGRLVIIRKIIIRFLTSVLMLSGFSCINPIPTLDEHLPKFPNAVLKASPVLISSVIISKLQVSYPLKLGWPEQHQIFPSTAVVSYFINKSDGT